MRYSVRVGGIMRRQGMELEEMIEWCAEMLEGDEEILIEEMI